MNSWVAPVKNPCYWWVGVWLLTERPYRCSIRLCREFAQCQLTRISWNKTHMPVIFEALLRWLSWQIQHFRKIMFQRTEHIDLTRHRCRTCQNLHAVGSWGWRSTWRNLKDLWAMCMRYPCVDIPVWFDPPGVMGAGSSNLDRSNLNTRVVDSSDDWQMGRIGRETNENTNKG